MLFRSVGDLQDFTGDLRALVGSWAPELKKFAFGQDDRPLDLGDDVKSISSENTFLRDTDDRPTLRDCMREQADDIARRLTRRRLAAHTVQVKVRYGDFTTLTRQRSSRIRRGRSCWADGFTPPRYAARPAKQVRARTGKAFPASLPVFPSVEYFIDNR